MSFPFVQPYFGLGNSLQTAQGGSGAVGGWVELGRSSSLVSDEITVSSLADKRYYMILANSIPSGSTDHLFRVGNSTIDTGTNYSHRQSNDGGADGTSANDSFLGGSQSDANPKFSVSYIANLSAKEKLAINHYTLQSTAGAATAPRRREEVSKWANTSNPIDIIRLLNSGSTFTSGELVVLGWDPAAADTHTTNFWEELASGDLSGGASATLDVSFTAKKYIWIQLFNDSKTLNDATIMQFGSTTIDTGSNYSRRHSDNGGADSTATSQTSFFLNAGNTILPSFTNLFMINNASNEKLCIGHTINQSTAGAANAPTRKEIVAKWTNTSNQADIVRLSVGSGTMGTGTFMKVWGSD